ncbi:flagellar hook protein FlgE [Phenylobacterium soli]|uniref:Flagellar hook protein FlgE n=1 Tax=Phenylobacterium soli TaxID=2170551 RepID=A0A328AFU3_9CAUL|nr:flagellar hook protein FlgE [Phenylobacterium soli]RAK51678.1 transposase [Phenylobacterium soli]
MSINSAMLAGVSGLVANSSALAAISDNISNVNTVAYKRNQVNFANVVTSQAVAGRYSAGGVQGVTHSYVSTQGLIQSTARTTDLAISGDGFFVVTQKASNLTPSDAREFTRSGSFNVDANGYLVNDSGLYLQGWPASATGTFALDPSDVNKLSSINVKNLGSALQPTGNLGVVANLDSGTPVSAAITSATYSAASATTSMAAYAAGVATGTKPDFTLDMNVIDSQGNSHKFEMAFLKDSTANTWKTEVYAVPASDVNAGANGQIAAGDVGFLGDGTFDPATTTLTIPIALNASSGAAPAWATSLGVNAQNINVDLTKLTQQSGASTVTTITNDGAGIGNIVGVQVDAHGVVSAIYDNSQVRKIAKVAVATFPNPDALKPVSGNAYQVTIPAGQMVLKDPGVGGAGQISPSSLEASTVDLSSEFTGLISTQKAYSASSKIITTADQMLDELINIIR